MKFFAIVALALFAGVAGAQSPPPVPASAVVSWTLPTTASDGSALAGPQALTEIQLFAAVQPIADNSAMTATQKLAPTATTATYTATVANGSKLYFRARACNVGGCSAFSNEVMKPVMVAVPGAPSGAAVTITIVIQS